EARLPIICIVSFLGSLPVHMIFPVAGPWSAGFSGVGADRCGMNAGIADVVFAALPGGAGSNGSARCGALAGGRTSRRRAGAGAEILLRQFFVHLSRSILDFEHAALALLDDGGITVPVDPQLAPHIARA